MRPYFSESLIESNVYALHSYFLNDKNIFPYDLKSVNMYLILGNLVLIAKKRLLCMCASKSRHMLKIKNIFPIIFSLYISPDNSKYPWRQGTSSVPNLKTFYRAV